MLRFIGIICAVSLVCGAGVLIAEKERDAFSPDTTLGNTQLITEDTTTLPDFGAEFKGFAHGATGNIDIDLWRLYKEAQEGAKDLGTGGAKGPCCTDPTLLLEYSFPNLLDIVDAV